MGSTYKDLENLAEAEMDKASTERERERSAREPSSERAKDVLAANIALKDAARRILNMPNWHTGRAANPTELFSFEEPPRFEANSGVYRSSATLRVLPKGKELPVRVEFTYSANGPITLTIDDETFPIDEIDKCASALVVALRRAIKKATRDPLLGL
jgi:hypothetical protein